MNIPQRKMPAGEAKRLPLYTTGFCTARRNFLQLPLVVTVALTLIFVVSGRLCAQNMPPGFALRKVANIILPTCFAFAPDGRIFVCEQRGRLRVIQNGVLLSTPAITLSVDFALERGLVGIAFDPDFTINNHIYLFYTTPGPNYRNRVSRFTLNGNVVVPHSETVLLEIDDLTAAIHNGGILRFGPDGKLYISVGDGGAGSNSQSLSNLKGKILRINKDGTIPEDNPLYHATTGVNRAIICYGLRNPYTFAIQPGTGRMFINDVGQNAWEEINEYVPGGNYGWPLSEGPTSNPDFIAPFFAYRHFNAPITGCAITGGDFYNPGAPMFPAEYIGQYFFCDYCNGWIRTIDPVTGEVRPFFDGLNMSLVDLKVGPDGALYYVSRTGTNSINGLYRIIYQPRQIAFQAQLEGASPGWQQVEVELRPVSGGTIIRRTLLLDDEGNASVDGVSPIPYQLSVKADRWLRRTVVTDATNGDVANVQITLLAGDANNDNVVDVLDLALVIGAFDALEGDAHWNPGADLNVDGSVDILDLDLLIRNFDLTGDA